MSKSFTLIEILVVIVIIGILSAFIIVSMAGVSDKARVAKGQAFANSLKNSLMMNLVAEYKFNASGVADGQPATADYVKDSWGSNNGSIGGAPLVRTGSNCLADSCLEFNGTNDNINIGTGTTITNLSEKTVIFWIKSSDGYANGCAWYAGYWNDPYGDMAYGYAAENKMTVYLKNTAGTTVSWYKVIELSPNKWKQMGYTWNGSTARLIDDGNFVSNTLSLGGTMGSTTSNLIGAGNGYFKGLIDEFRIYNKAIGSSEVKQDYYSGLNKLLAKNEMEKQEYSQKINQLASN
ncbi:MAG: LamG domain-containing protein [Candidatus Paceibacterota bacterium]|jgi:prepilin-type N-terminal cleavage/methylation domain-containing protein